VPIHSSIEDKIAWAYRALGEHGSALREDQTVVRLLDQLRAESQASRQAMAATGVVAVCRHCDEWDGGSCCGAGIEDRYDGITLLINLLLGVSLPTRRQRDGGCFFLGPAGCALQARDVICINFMCREVVDAVGDQALAQLRDVEGAELQTLFQLHDRIARVLG
jgi:hypothetical protein